MSERARCQHCSCWADERSFMCESCAYEADTEVQDLRDRVDTLEAAIRAHRDDVRALYNAETPTEPDALLWELVASDPSSSGPSSSPEPLQPDGRQ
jgi:hypothetical protein